MIATLLAATLAFAPNKGVLVVDCLVIGRMDNGNWRTVNPVEKDPVGKLRNLKFEEQKVGSKGKSFTTPKLELMVDAAPGWYFSGEAPSQRVLWSGSAIVAPPVRRLSPTSAYLKVVGDYLKSKNLKKATPKIQAVYSIDLDNNGTQEILIEAAPRLDMSVVTMNETTEKDYSILLARFIRNGKVVTQVLEHNDGRGGNLSVGSRFRAIADFDGNKRYEVVTSANYYEGTSASVWLFKNSKFSKLIENGSGV